MTDHNDNINYNGDQVTSQRLLAALRKLNVETLTLAGDLALAQQALTDQRRAYADLVAACRAGLLAAGEGDPDPWGYIVDELPAAPEGHPLHTQRYGHGEPITRQPKEQMPMTDDCKAAPATAAETAQIGGDAH